VDKIPSVEALVDDQSVSPMCIQILQVLEDDDHGTEVGMEHCNTELDGVVRVRMIDGVVEGDCTESQHHDMVGMMDLKDPLGHSSRQNEE
jgi:hypothetical protein